MWTGAMSRIGKLNSIFVGNSFWYVRGYCESYSSSSQRAILFHALPGTLSAGDQIALHCAHRTNAGSSGLFGLFG
jgi:hypothetical protein